MYAKKLYPLKLNPIYKEKVWGGRTLELLDRTLPGTSNTHIGESWELADLNQTSVSGGGGSPEHSLIANGEFSGQTISELIQSLGPAITGSLPLTDSNSFPLLVKFLDAKTNLSVQVHPSQKYADAHEDAFLKSECWYILHAEPGAVIYKGVKEGTTEGLFRQAIKSNTVEELLIKVPVNIGDCHYVPSGTCHALGQGILAAEVQTPSDTTFRVYDWGRTGRELHIDAAMQCMTLGPAETSKYEPNITTDGQYASRTQLITCKFFNLDRYIAKSNFTDPLTNNEPIVWMFLEGSGHFSCDASPHIAFEKGQTFLIPPNISNLTVEMSEGTTWLETTFPQAEPDTRIA
ncbi:putative mannose-6-phosphate isomerase GmuF [Poriferisphaera corsica]|uniref:Putative mannose-6-phosphate isomerase GmuF n=1 Tax=Poriferisphaera corsica TaxID=2528020 RepID=A0A517YVW2_9BACT|nr:type I phosphomannose isomerase catalytic subunit [Poriferisphaera corsica]QDU34343.1 putative mannose-6-phosphate isomerase GmuF [Poriferisphaera corsica]